MQHLDSVEEILGRLMPPALSQACEEEIGATLDRLAGGDTTAAATPPCHLWRWWAGGLAAAGAAAAFLLPTLPEGNEPFVSVPQRQINELVLVSESGRVETMLDEGLRDIGDGSAMHATRLSVVEESNLLDEETGIVLQISEPREEVLLMPVSAF